MDVVPNLKRRVSCNKQLRLLVLKRLREEGAARAVSVWPGRRFASNLSPVCSSQAKRNSKASYYLYLSPQEGQAGVTSLIASTVFSFVDRESCLEETDPVATLKDPQIIEIKHSWPIKWFTPLQNILLKKLAASSFGNIFFSIALSSNSKPTNLKDFLFEVTKGNIWSRKNTS